MSILSTETTLRTMSGILSMIDDKGECTVSRALIKELFSENYLLPSGLRFGPSTEKQIECWCKAHQLRYERDLHGTYHLCKMLGPDGLSDQEKENNQ